MITQKECKEVVMSTFVNPLPGTPIFKWIGFDFPADTRYRAKGCLPNLNPKKGPEAPMVEDVYGRLGYPPMEQGFPIMREHPYPEEEDPKLWPFHDQIIDRDREACIWHTGRLSGSFAKYIVQSDHKSLIKMHANPIDHSGPIVPLYNEEKELVPQTPLPDQWFWLDPKTESELLYTARAIIGKDTYRKMEPGIYTLVVNWEFLDYKKGGPPATMPMSGFCDEITFKLTPGTKNL